jgi:chaperonin GroEL
MSHNPAGMNPALVTVSMQNAASIAGLMLTTACMLAESPDDKPAAGGMGGMM